MEGERVLGDREGGGDLMGEDGRRKGPGDVDRKAVDGSEWKEINVLDGSRVFPQGLGNK
jgi:hypothetical protein